VARCRPAGEAAAIRDSRNNPGPRASKAYGRGSGGATVPLCITGRARPKVGKGAAAMPLAVLACLPCLSRFGTRGRDRHEGKSGAASSSSSSSSSAAAAAAAAVAVAALYILRAKTVSSKTGDRVHFMTEARDSGGRSLE
jgi:hypothetical protein